MIPDQRSRNVIEQALDWAAANPESLEFVHSDKVGRKGHLPNMVGFGNLLGGIERQSAIWNRSVECIEGTARLKAAAPASKQKRAVSPISSPHSLASHSRRRSAVSS